MSRPERRHACGRVEISATRLAEMGYCEKRIVLAHRHGEATTSAQQRARRRGQIVHERYRILGESASRTNSRAAFPRWGRLDWAMAACLCIVRTACGILAASAFLRRAAHAVLTVIAGRRRGCRGASHGEGRRA
jgi:hypothetical protein